MKESIYTIPIRDVLEVKKGCPICKMREMLLNRCVEYILGAAMMEPDIRIETNRLGFCHKHLCLLASQNKKLPLALMLESHLEERKQNFVLAKSKKKELLSSSCFICSQIDQALQKLTTNLIRTFFTDSSFRELFAEQEFFCISDYEYLCHKVSLEFNKKQAAEFLGVLTPIVQNYLLSLQKDIHSFTQMFDYRNAGKKQEKEEVTGSIGRAIDFLR